MRSLGRIIGRSQICEPMKSGFKPNERLLQRKRCFERTFR
jgi:hypothetical protein